eukprot:gnl/TRDRNA2_/TRDRNA2_41613_c0_seq1.p1 gnl/TRDRNA2_/TRDRNA2_41613_c0~~gnl/TRDRNA2_/TRDRNA2_41613_c0_seq1.p1  ORF type:complete len:200 (-),score=29.49 gnl/TRDRNA2_/TRDRNA2_41613_c0_seq1:118-717(-)
MPPRQSARAPTAATAPAGAPAAVADTPASVKKEDAFALLGKDEQEVFETIHLQLLSEMQTGGVRTRWSVLRLFANMPLAQIEGLIDLYEAHAKDAPIPPGSGDASAAAQQASSGSVSGYAETGPPMPSFVKTSVPPVVPSKEPPPVVKGTPAPKVGPRPKGPPIFAPQGPRVWAPPPKAPPDSMPQWPNIATAQPATKK